FISINRVGRLFLQKSIKYLLELSGKSLLLGGVKLFCLLYYALQGIVHHACPPLLATIVGSCVLCPDSSIKVSIARGASLSMCRDASGPELDLRLQDLLVDAYLFGSRFRERFPGVAGRLHQALDALV